MSEEKQKIYIARDMKDGKQPLGHLWIYLQKPTLYQPDGSYDGGVRAMRLPTRAFQEIKEGECYEAEIVLGEKVK